MIKKTLIASTAVLLLAGCASSGSTRTPVLSETTDPLLHAVHSGADRLALQLTEYPLSVPVIVASAQNGDQLNKVCAEGRLISDMVSSRLSQWGFPVTEVRVTQALRINKEGETILSREIDDLASSAKADVVVTATWSTVEVPTKKAQDGFSRQPDERTYVTLKAVRIQDGLVVGSQTFAAPTAWRCAV